MLGARMSTSPIRERYTPNANIVIAGWLIVRASAVAAMTSGRGRRGDVQVLRDQSERLALLDGRGAVGQGDRREFGEISPALVLIEPVHQQTDQVRQF